MRRCLSTVLPLAVLFLLCTKAHAWLPYDQSARLDQYDSLPIPPVEETLYFRGFRLTIDRTQLGIESKGSNALRLTGDDFALDAFRTPRNMLTSQAARLFEMEPSSLLTTSAYHAQNHIQGIKAVYGRKEFPFGNKVQEICYFLKNSQGETICFRAQARRPGADWDYLKYLMTERIALASPGH